MIKIARHFGLLLAAAALATAQESAPANPSVEIKTSMGSIVLELNKAKAPITVENFLKYVEAKHYDGTVFHRVISDFMIQGGGFEKKGDQLVEKATNAPIKNEASNGLKNENGTIAMARTSAPDSATAQFFINVKDNSFLDHSPGNPGYAVFGKVVKGLEVVSQIKGVQTKVRELNSRLPSGQHRPMPSEDVPVSDVVIESVRVIDAAAKADAAEEKKAEEKK